MRKQGYTIDQSCYPWYAYKGGRFGGREQAHECLTDTEEEAFKFFYFLVCKLEAAYYANLSVFEQQIVDKLVEMEFVTFNWGAVNRSEKLKTILSNQVGE